MNTKRYAIEVAYDGTKFSGFQIQKNANSIQGELEKTLSIFYKQPCILAGSSRTDAGVNAYQNFFQWDTDLSLRHNHLYNLNAILPTSIVIKNIYQIGAEKNVRFDALSRTYHYKIYQQKDPFKIHGAYFYPYPLSLSALNQAAQTLLSNENFETFSKKNTQVNHFNCKIHNAKWVMEDGSLIFKITANRFLRGMVKGLVGTTLLVGRNLLTIEAFKAIMLSQDCSKANFSPPSKGLYLVEVAYPAGFLKPI